jgi:peptidoglycan/LPS O-acetylase OafA/YrhL
MQTAKDFGGKVTDLQVLRGISIVLVLLYHLSLPHTLLGFSAAKPNMPFYLGVEIFFIISGYVVTLSLLKDGCNGPRFFVRRVFRLVPAMFLFLLFSCALHGYIRGSGMPVYVKEQFTVPTRDFVLQETGILFGFFTQVSAPHCYLNGAMWSLSVEDQFYAALALLCLVVAVLSQQSERAAKWSLLVIAGVLLSGVSACRVAVLVGTDLRDVLPEAAAYLLRWRFDFLALGIVLAFVAQKLRGSIRSYFKERGNFLAPLLLVIPLIVTSLCESQYTDALTVRALTGLGMPLAAACFGLLVLLAADNLAFPTTRGFLYRFLLYLGDRSYTYYLFHFPVFVVAWLLIYRFAPATFNSALRYGVAQVVLVTVLLCPLVEVVYRFVELPLMRLGKRLTHVAPAAETILMTLPIGLPTTPHKHQGAA